MSGFLNRSVKDLSIDDIRRLIRDEVAVQIPPIPAAVAQLADNALPVTQPPVLKQGEVLLWNAQTGKYESAGISDISGQIVSTQITDHSISTPQLDANLVLAGTFATGVTNPKVVVDSGGITIFDASGVAVVVVPSAGTTSFQGNMSTGNLQVSGNLQISGATNVMNQASLLTLNEGYANPNLAPTVSYEHEQSAIVGWTPLTDSSFAPALFPANGLSYTASGSSGTPSWFYLDSPDKIGTGVGTAAMLEIGAAATVNQVKNNIRIKLTTPAFYTGTAYIGSVCWVGFVTSAGKVKMVSVDPATGNVSASITLDNAPVALPDHGIAFYGDGTNLYLATWAGTGTSKVKIRKYSTAGALLATTTTTSGTAYNATDSPIIAAGAFDGTNHWIVFARNNGTFIEEYVDATGVKVANSQMYFSSASDANIVYGIGWDGTNMWGWPYTIATGKLAGTMARLSSLTWAPGTDKWYFAYEWNDGATHATALGPISAALDLSASYSSAQQRGRFKLTVPSFPAGTVQVDTYAANAGSTPATSAMKLQAPTSFVSSNTLTNYFLTALNAAGAAGNNANNFAGGTSNIQGTFSQGTPWKVGGDGTFVLPAWATAHRLPGAANGQVGWNTDLAGLDLMDAASNWLTMYNPRDTEDIFDALLALEGFTGGGGGTANHPIAYTIDPETINGSLTMAAGVCRGAAFMVKRSIPTASVGIFVDVTSVGALTNYTGFTLFSLNAAGDWVFVANTGATQANTFTNSQGWHSCTWMDAATGLVPTTVTLSPGTIYVVAATIGTYATTQPAIGGYNPTALTAAAGLASFGTSYTAKPQRNAQTAASKTAKITATITVANLAAATFIPLIALW